MQILFLRIPGEFLDWLRARKVLKGTDAVMMTGTAMLTDYSGTAFGYPYDILKWAVAARTVGCKVRFVSVGVGPIYERLSRFFVKAALSLADYRSFRNNNSKARLAKLGFDASNDPVVPDLAFSLPPGLFPQSHGRGGRRPAVGLGVMNHFDPRAMGEQNRATAYRTYLDKMADFAGQLIGKGYSVQMLQGDVKWDGAARRDLRTELERRGFDYGRASIVDEGATSVESLLAQLALTDVVVSPRYHTLLLGLMLGKPVISISYDIKNDALLGGLGLGQYCQPYHQLDVPRLIEQVKELEASFAGRKPLLAQKAEEYRASLDQQYERIFSDL